MATIRELGQGAQKLSHPFKMADGNAAAGVAAVDARIEQGRQIIDMNDAAVTLVLGEAATGQVRMVNSLLYVDPNSTGATEDLTMPAAADWRGPVSIVNTGGETIVVKNAAGIVAGTITPRAMGIVTSDGTNIYMVFAPRGEAAVQRATGEMNTTAVTTDLHTASGVELVAAPGAGFYLEFVSIHLWFDYTASFTSGGNITVNLSTDVQSTLVANTFLQSAADAHVVLTPADNMTLSANTALILKAASQYGGGIGSTLKYSILYRIRPLEFSV